MTILKKLKFETLTEPPTEQNITKNWLTGEKCKVSIDMLVYNHEKYLHDALNSILNQKTNFPFEILIHDDASQDSSQEILKEYELKYPNIVKPIYQKENQYSQNINPAIRFNYSRANSPYLAICEGDDFWTDINKLQKQIDILDANPSINMCFHQAYELDYLDALETINIIGDYADKNSIIPFTNILFLTRGMIPTASCVIRHQQKEKTREFIDARNHLTLGDLYMQFFGAYPTGAFYLNQKMSFYRKRTENSWTLNITKSLDFKHKHEKAMLTSYIELNELTNKSFDEKFAALTLQRLLWIFKPKPEFKNNLASSILDIERDNDTSLNKEFIPELHEYFLGCQNNIYNTLKSWETLNGNKIIYGAGSGCKLILDTLGAFSISAIVDRDDRRSGKTINKTKIINEEMLLLTKNTQLLISTPSADKNHIIALANKAKIPKENIHYLFDTAIDWLLQNRICIKKLVK